MLRVVADTNVYISALNFGGAPDQVLALARRGRIEMFVSKPILDEIEGVLKGKFQWPPSRTRHALTAISEFAKEVKATERVAALRRALASELVALPAGATPWRRPAGR